MAGIQGMQITLYERTQTGTDNFNRPVYTETATAVDNVLVGEPSTEDITTDLTMYGKRLAYTLAIPKGDTHDWKDVKVAFWGETFRTYGAPTQGIEENIPLYWNMKVKVERYE